MPEWWSYTLADFLMFSPRVYWRLIERYNTAIRPAQVAAVLAGLALAALARVPGPRRGRTVAIALGLAWAAVAWGFLWTRYAGINWPARWFAALFGLQALLLAWFGARGRVLFGETAGIERVCGLALLVASVVLYPALAVFDGRGWGGAEVFGLMPDPTAIGTVGLLLLVGDLPTRRLLLIVPLLWCLVAGLTLLALEASHAWAPGAALLAAGAGLARRGPAR